MIMNIKALRHRSPPPLPTDLGETIYGSLSGEYGTGTYSTHDPSFAVFNLTLHAPYDSMGLVPADITWSFQTLFPPVLAASPTFEPIVTPLGSAIADGFKIDFDPALNDGDLSGSYYRVIGTYGGAITHGLSQIHDLFSANDFLISTPVGTAESGTVTNGTNSQYLRYDEDPNPSPFALQLTYDSAAATVDYQIQAMQMSSVESLADIIWTRTPVIGGTGLDPKWDFSSSNISSFSWIDDVLNIVGTNIGGADPVSLEISVTATIGGHPGIAAPNPLVFGYITFDPS